MENLVFSDLPPCIDEATQSEEQADEQSGILGNEEDPHGSHSGCSWPGTRLLHVGTYFSHSLSLSGFYPIKSLFDIFRIFNLDSS